MIRFWLTLALMVMMLGILSAKPAKAQIYIEQIGNYNNVLVEQSGSHYADIKVSGANKTVDVLQQGTASHAASVTLSGEPVNLSLTQVGSVNQTYSITSNCATPGGCGPIIVRQGQ